MKTLLAIYVVVAWNLHGGSMHRQEFELSLPDLAVGELESQNWRAPHFFSEDLCEEYRPKLVDAWIRDPKVPFHRENIISSYCAPWTPNPNLGTDL